MLALSHLLAPSQFVYYGWTMAIVTAVMAVGDLGYGGALIRSGRAGELLGEAIARHRRRIVPGVLVAMLVIALVPIQARVRVPALLLALTTLFLAQQMVPTAVFEADGRFAAIGAIEVVQRLVLIGGAVLLAAVFDAGWVTPAAAACSGLLGAVLALRLARSSTKRSEPPRAERTSSAEAGLDLAFSRSWLIGRIASQANYGVYPVVGTLLLSTRHLGLVLWALSVSALPALGSQLTARILFPALVSRAREAPTLHVKVLIGLLIVGGPLVGAMIIYAAPLTQYVFGVKWLPAVTALRIECVNTLLGLVLTPIVPVLYVVATPKHAGRLLVAYASSTWLLALLLAGPFGLDLTAIPWATVISTSGMLIATEIALRRAGTTGLEKLLGPAAVIGLLTTAGVLWHPAVHSAIALVGAMIALLAIGVAAMLPFRRWLLS